MKKYARIAMLVAATFCVTVGTLNANTNNDDGVSLNIPFDPDVLTYSTTVPNTVTEITVNASASHPSARVTVNGGNPGTPVALTVGANIITIVVTAEDSRYQRTYTVTVTRDEAAAAQSAIASQEQPVELNGTDGPDELEGGDGDDVLHGGKGKDVLRGQGGNDELRGQDGNDKLFGGVDDDELHGGRGDDVLRGGKGRDVLFGGAGNDDLYGGGAADELHGGSGNDKLAGGKGADTYTGGPGADRFVFVSGDTGDKIITDFGKGDDLIVLKAGGDPWPSVANIIAGVVAQGDRYLVYTVPLQPPYGTRGRATGHRSVSTIRCSTEPAGPLSKAVAVCCSCCCRPSTPLAAASPSSLTKRWRDAGDDASTSAVTTATPWLLAASVPSAPVGCAGSC